MELYFIPKEKYAYYAIVRLPHAAPHTLLLETGANPLDVQARLGHSPLAITWKYAHNTDAICEQTIKILSMNIKS